LFSDLIAEHGPVTVVADDLQWLGQPSR